VWNYSSRGDGIIPLGLWEISIRVEGEYIKVDFGGKLFALKNWKKM